MVSNIPIVRGEGPGRENQNGSLATVLSGPFPNGVLHNMIIDQNDQCYVAKNFTLLLGNFRKRSSYGQLSSTGKNGAFSLL